MTRPRIGITTYVRNEAHRFTLPAEYVDSTRRAGATTLLLAPGEPAPEEWLQELDGIVLAGGGDLAPEVWGAAPNASNYGVDAERDQTELELARAVLELRLPSLWICRGMQLLNVALGGTLVEHIPDRFGETVLHRLPPREPVGHEVQLEPGCRLAQTMGGPVIQGISWHHQGLDELGEGLTVVGWAPDSVIEAVELLGHPEVQAVQWHPELSAAEDDQQQRLFNELVNQASRQD